MNLKELRLASEDLLKETLGSASKDDVTPLSIPQPAPETLHIVLDAAIKDEALVAVHGATSASTVLMSGKDVAEYVKALKGAGEVKEVDFKELKAAQGEEPKKVAAPIAYVSFAQVHCGE